jgi:hypothetical protein
MANENNTDQYDANDFQDDIDPSGSANEGRSLSLLKDMESTSYNITEDCDVNKIEKAIDHFDNQNDLRDPIGEEDVIELLKQEAKTMIDILRFINQASKEIVLKGFLRKSGS